MSQNQSQNQKTGRISRRFAELAAAKRSALIPYIVAGEPFAGDFTAQLMQRLVAAGADLIEVGVPFSDPMAEGPVIQRGHERALQRGITLQHSLDAVAQFRQQDKDTPVLLMGYANPVERMGYAALADAGAKAGLDGLLTVDMPPEEVAPLNKELQRVGMDNIFLVAPTTPPPRIARIAALATGFIYYVAFKGVTGAAHLDVAAVPQHLQEIRRHTDLPLAVGFGIKDAASARAIAKTAQGVVVGSALVQAMADCAAGGGDENEVAQVAAELMANIREGIDGP